MKLCSAVNYVFEILFIVYFVFIWAELQTFTNFKETNKQTTYPIAT